MSTDTKTIKFKFAQGIMRESTQFAAEGGWSDGNRVRFRDGKPENIRGWQKHDTDSFIGTSRAIHSWSSLDNQKLVAFATEHKVYLYQGGSFYDNTPIQSSATNATGNTSSTSAQVVVTVEVNAPAPLTVEKPSVTTTVAPAANATEVRTF